MIETGILNQDIASELAKLGHTDKFLIADAGFAIPNEKKVIDISLAENKPTTIDILREIVKHFSTEKIIYSNLTHQVSPSKEKMFLSFFGEDVEIETVSQEYLRNELIKEIKFVIRTGDFTAYSNIVLVSSGGPRWFIEKNQQVQRST